MNILHAAPSISLTQCEISRPHTPNGTNDVFNGQIRIVHVWYWINFGIQMNRNTPTAKSRTRKPLAIWIIRTCVIRRFIFTASFQKCHSKQTHIIILNVHFCTLSHFNSMIECGNHCEIITVWHFFGMVIVRFASELETTFSKENTF